MIKNSIPEIIKILSFAVLAFICSCICIFPANYMISVQEEGKNYKTNYLIQTEEDLDGDGVRELIPAYTGGINEPPRVFYVENGNNMPVKGDKGAEVDPVISKGVPAVYFLNNGAGKTMFLIGQACCREDMAGKGYDSGNIILAYRYNNRKLTLLNKYFSDYELQGADINANTEYAQAPLGREYFEAVIPDITGTTLLVQKRDGSIYFLDPAGNLTAADYNIPVEASGLRIKSFKMNNDELIAVEEAKGKFKVVSSTRGTIEDASSDFDDPVGNIKLLPDSDRFTFESGTFIRKTYVYMYDFDKKAITPK